MQNSQSIVWKIDEINIMDKDGQEIPGYFEYFRQIYAENCKLFEEHYTVFHKYETVL